MPGIGHRGAGSEEPITDPADVKQDNLPIPQDELEVASRPARSRPSGSELPAGRPERQAQQAGPAIDDARSLATVARSSSTSRVSSATRLPPASSRDSAISRMRRTSR